MLGNGTYTVWAKYSGDTKWHSAINTTKFTVSKVNTTVDINVVQPITYDNYTNITVTVENGVDGFITLTINDGTNNITNITLPVVEGKVNWIKEGLAAGSYTVYANYTGSARYNINDTESKNFVINQAAPVFSVDVVTVDANTNPIVKVKVNDTMSGKLNITVYNKNYTADIIDGIATFTVDKLPVDQYDVNVTYKGDNNYTYKSQIFENRIIVTKVTCYPINVTAIDVLVGVNTTITVHVPKDATGTITVWVNGTGPLTNSTIRDGVATFTLNKTISGRYGVNATLSNSKYADKTAYTNFWVSEHETPISIDVKPIYVGDKAIIEVTVPKGVINNVTIELEGKAYNKSVDANGKARFEVQVWSNGTRTVVATYGGDNKYLFNSTTANFTVTKRTPVLDVTATGNSVGSNATISVSLPTNATGYVTVNVNGTNYTIKLNGGAGSVQIAGLGNGTYYVHATYLGDRQYFTATNNDKTFEMTKLDTTMGISVTDIDYGQKANITVTITNGATGFITIRINETRNITLPIGNGKVNWIVDNLAADNYTVYANYSGDGKYNINNTNKVNKSFEVKRISPEIKIVHVDSTAGESATVIVSIDSRATQTINVNVDKDYIKQIGDGIITVITDRLADGTYTVTASYAGDKNFTSDSKTRTFTTNKTSDYNINITTYDIKVGDLTNIIVNVPADASGKVILEIEGHNYTATISQGKAVFNNQTNLGAGRYNVTAYFGDGKYVNKTATGVFAINKYDVPLDISVGPIKVGDKATITVTAPSEVLDDIVIEIDGVKYDSPVTTSGKAVFEVQIWSNGTRTVVASYAGNNKYLANSTIDKFDVTKRTANLDVTATGNSVGSNATISVSLPTNATGYVTVNVNGTNYTINLTQGAGSLQIAGLGNGTYYVHATYLGDRQYFTTTNNDKTFEMTKLNTTMAISVESIDYTQKANITVTVKVDATGFITIRINNTRSITLPIVDGKVNWIVDNLAADNYTVYANYSGDGKYNINNTNKVNKSFEVRQITPAITIETVEVNSAKNATVVVHITSGTTGNINITVNGQNYSGPIENGVARIVIDQFNEGSYSVFANYTGDKNFTNASTTQDNKVIVHKFSCYNMTVTANDTEVGANTTIVVNVPIDAVGNVSIYINGVFADNATISQGVAKLNVTKYIAGKYVVNATFTDGKYANKTVTTNYHVLKVDTPIDISVNPIYVGDKAIVEVTVPAGIRNNVTIEINGIKYNKSVNDQGKAIFEIADLTYGNKTVVATYDGDNKYVFNSTTANFTVDKRISQVNVTYSASVVGMDTIINVTIPANATGYVIINVNGTEYTVNTTNGNGSIVIKNLANGDYWVNVTYLGDNQYFESTNHTDFTISRLLTQFTVNGTNITYGAKELITIETADNITAKVIVEINKKNYTAVIYEGKGNLTVENLAAGEYNVTVYFEGNYKYMNTTANNTFKVDKATIPVIVIPQNITYGEVEIFTIYVNGTGKVNITVVNEVVYLNKQINNGKLEFELPGYLAAGNYTVVVDYSGNENYTVNTAKANFTVAKKDPVITVEVQNITYGGIEHIIVRVNAPGNVTIRVNNTERTIVLKDGEGGKDILRAIIAAIKTYDVKATLDVYNLNAGTYPVEVTYNGNENYNKATVSTFFVVGMLNTTVNVAVDNITVADKQIINVTISDVNATGNVTINVDGVNYTRPIVNGTANLTLDKVSAGNHSVVVIYEGDNNLVGNWTSKTFAVDKIKPELTIEVTNTTVGKTEKILVHLPDNATGFVVIDVDGTKYHVDIVKGKEIALEIDDLINKTYNVAVEYYGDDFWDSANNSTSFNVNGTKADISVKVENITIGDKAIINITTPKDLYGNVTVTVDDKNYTVYVAGGNGILIVPDLGIGNYTVDVIFDGNDKYGASKNTTEFEISKVNITSEDIKVIDQGNGTVVVVVPGNATGNVTIYVDGQNFTGEVINGTARITVENVTPGVQNITVVYEGDDTHTNATVNSTMVVPKLESPLTVNITEAKEGGNATVTVTVPGNATGNVTVTVDGQKYAAEVINGTAVVTVENLTAGNKTIVVEYSGDANRTANYTVSNFTVEQAKVVPDIVVVDQGNGTVVVVVGGNATGNVTITVGDKNFTGEVINGTAIVNVGNLTPGNNTVEVIYSGDGTHTNATVETVINGPKYDSPINVTVGEVKEGENATVTVTVPGNATGNVTVTVDGQRYTAEVINGTATVTVENLTAGPKSVIVEYEGDSNYSSNYTVSNFTVDKVKEISEVIVVDQGNGTVVVVVGGNATGNVTIKVGDKNFTGEVINGTAIVNVGNLTPGNNTVEVIYSGDGTHTNTTVETVINGPKYDSPINVTVGEVKEGENATVTVTVPGNATGNVTVTVDGQKYSVEVINGTAIVEVENLTAGPKSVLVEYSGDGNYTANYTSSDFTVDKAKVISDIVVVDQGNGTVVVVVGGNATGNMTIKVGDKNFTADVINGTAVITLDNITPGNNTVEVIYSGDGTHTNSTIETVINGPKYDSPINVTVGEAKEGENVTITVDMPKDASGNVTVTVDGQRYTAEVINGTATVTVENLTAGPKSVIVEYEGDSNYSSNYTVSDFTVDKAKVISDIVVVDQGNGTVVVVVGGNATGNVTIKVGDKDFTADVINGTAVVNVGNLTPGNNTVEVIYSGDGTHANSTVESVIVGPKYDSPINVTVSEVTEGEPLVITVEVPANATGNVTVYVDGKEYPGEINDGVAVVIVDNLAAGNKTFVVEYSGDGNFTANYTIGNLTVKEAKVVPDMKVIDQGNGTVVVVVGGNATGNVTIKVGDKNVTAEVINGTAIVNVDNLTPGNNTVEVIYSGDGTHTNSTVETVIVGPKYESLINVTVGEAKEGENVTITVDVPKDASGNVTVTIDGQKYTAEVINGTAVVTVENLTAGPKSVIVEYEGDSNYVSNYTISDFTVEKAKTTPEVIVVDQGNGTVVVVVPDNASGNVTIKVGDKNFTGEVINGTAVITLDNITAGETNITVIYEGDESHNPTTVNSTVNVPKAGTPISVTVEDIKVGDTAIIKVNVPDKASGNITLEIDGEKYSSKINDGVATFEIKDLIAGTKTIAVEYDGDDNYLSNHTTSRLTVSKADSYVNATITDIEVGENVIITVIVPEDATGQVLIDIDGVGYYVNVTHGIGVAEIPRMPNGVYDVNLTYVGDDKYLPSSNNGSFNVSKIPSYVIPSAHDIRVGDNEVITFILPSDATGTLIVIVDGKEYHFNLEDGTLSAHVDANDIYTVAVDNGRGKLTISGLPKGEYTVSVLYEGNDKYLSSSNTTTFLVSKVAADIEVIDYKNRTVVVEVPENATGNVTVIVENQTYVADISDGKAVIYLENVTPGIHDMEIKYSGDDSYASKTVESSVNIPKYETPISVSVEDIYVGETAVVVVSVPENAEGIVTIEINGRKFSTEVVNGKAIFNVTGLAAGNKTVAVKYEDGDDYEWNSTTGQFEVLKVPSDITASAVNIHTGSDEIVTATVPSDATGRVLVTIGEVGYYGTVVNGKAKIIIPNLPAGKYDANVYYEGDDKYLPSNTAVEFSVLNKNTPISAKGDDIVVGDDANVVVNLPKDATGTVDIVVEGKKYSTKVDKGMAVFNIPGLSKGKYMVDVIYSGDENYPTNETVTTIDVRTSTPISAKGDNIEVGDDASVVVNLPKDATGTVTIIVEGKKYTAPVVNGKAVFHIPGLSKGKHTVKVIYSGDKNYSGNETVTTIDVDGNGSNGGDNHSGEGIVLSEYATGNPILILLIIILSVGVSQIRRLKK
ncbi:MAG: Ig-like domain repeat protein [Methanobrevibacter sp.]|uniref:Ig-like domain-containing protein n=1 Tax=Methanobrevibacter sp. TaxID=66852 RepID=UPI0025CFE21B|nr:Ig-like domain-containing protein [Methanobrevibacter sp.]MBQ6099892.1 Ig-like domain repeat protein [Methanobrevibacter sp.]